MPPELAQQMQASWRGGQGKGRAAIRPRQAANVTDLWDKYQKSGPTLRGDESDYEGFANQFGVGQKALNKLKKQHQQGVTVGSRRRYADEDSDRLHGPFAGYSDWEDCESAELRLR